MPDKSSVSNRDLYEAIGGLRTEFSGAIQRLDDKFMQLEAGRLTRLENKFSDFEVNQAKRDATLDRNQAVLSTKFIIIGGIIMALFNALLFGLFARIFR